MTIYPTYGATPSHWNLDLKFFNMRNDKPNVIVEKSFQFGVLIVDFSELLMGMKKFSMANQIFRSGTSIGANVREAQNAESRKDFIHKMKIAAKEADEVGFFLELCQASPHYPDTKKLRELNQEICLILSKIISTTKSNG